MNQYERMYDILINGINEDSAEAQDDLARKNELEQNLINKRKTEARPKKPGPIRKAWEKAKGVLSKMARISASAPESPSKGLDDTKL